MGQGRDDVSCGHFLSWFDCFPTNITRSSKCCMVHKAGSEDIPGSSTIGVFRCMGMGGECPGISRVLTARFLTLVNTYTIISTFQCQSECIVLVERMAVPWSTSTASPKCHCPCSAFSNRLLFQLLLQPCALSSNITTARAAHPYTLVALMACRLSSRQERKRNKDLSANSSPAATLPTMPARAGNPMTELTVQ